MSHVKNFGPIGDGDGSAFPGSFKPGVFDHVNRHQAIVIGCHISYQKHAGIKVEGSAPFVAGNHAST